MKSKKAITIVTAMASLFCSFALAIFGLIYNKYLLLEYGSQVTGLISTLTQFVSMFIILEGGYTTAALVATYSAVTNNDFYRINTVLFNLKRFLNRIGIIIFIASGVLGIAYLFFIDSPLAWHQTVSLLFITVSTTSFSIIFQSRYNVVFNAFNKQYIATWISLFTKTIVWAISLLMIMLRINVVFVYLMYSSSVLLNVFTYLFYIKKKYPLITFVGKIDKLAIQGSKDVFLQKIASTVFTSTDLVLISAGVGLGAASVYNIYHQIYNMVATAETSILHSPSNSLGLLFHENNRLFRKIYSIYLYATVFLVSVLSVSVGLTIVDFIRIYTKEILDINYIVPFVSLLFF